MSQEVSRHKDDRILNQIDDAKHFALETGIVSTREEAEDPLKTVQAQILRLFWTLSNRLITSELNLEMQHLILQDTVQMAKILKDWSLGDKTLNIKNKKDLREGTPSDLIDYIIEKAKKENVVVELPLDKLAELENKKSKSNEDNKIEDLGVTNNK